MPSEPIGEPPGPGAAIGLIWAQAANRVIGRDGTIPWRLPEDLAAFRARTWGTSVLMGRRTWESFPPRLRPLPGRRNLVLTRDPTWTADGAEVVGDPVEAIAVARAAGSSLWVIGGSAVYAAAMPYASVAVITELQVEVDGDTLAPVLDPDFVQVSDTGWLSSSAGPVYRIRELQRP